MVSSSVALLAELKRIDPHLADLGEKALSAMEAKAYGQALLHWRTWASQLTEHLALNGIELYGRSADEQNHWDEEGSPHRPIALQIDRLHQLSHEILDGERIANEEYRPLATEALAIVGQLWSSVQPLLRESSPRLIDDGVQPIHHAPSIEEASTGEERLLRENGLQNLPHSLKYYRRVGLLTLSVGALLLGGLLLWSFF